MWFEEQPQESRRSAGTEATLRAAAVQSQSLRFQKSSFGQLTMFWRACPFSKKASAEGSLSRRLLLITIVLPWAGIVDGWCDALSLAHVAPKCDYE